MCSFNVMGLIDVSFCYGYLYFYKLLSSVVRPLKQGRQLAFKTSNNRYTFANLKYQYEYKPVGYRFYVC
jgi:hypothetical protein